MGALEILAGGNRLHATVQFRRALCRNPDARPRGPIVGRPEVLNLFDFVASRYHEQPQCELVRRLREQAPGAREPELPTKGLGLICPTPDEALLGREFIVRCAVVWPSNVGGVRLRYRPRGSDAYAAVNMRRTPRGWWMAAIPARAVTGKSIAFYVEGFSTGGDLIVTNGEASSPNIALVMEGDGCVCD